MGMLSQMRMIKERAVGDAENERGSAPAAPVCVVGEPLVLSGHADDFEHAVAAVQFSLDDGAHWTTYPTAGVAAERGVSWRFSYTPQRAGTYLMRARAVDGEGNASALVSSYAFTVAERAESGDTGGGGPKACGATRSRREGEDADETALEQPFPALGETFGPFRLRPVGGLSFRAARVFRSGELWRVTPREADFIARQLGIRTVYDIRTRHETAAHPQPCLLGVRTVSLEPDPATRRKDAAKRLVAGVIGEYGAPEERMRRNYRRYVDDYALIGKTLRSMADAGTPALIHCVNGKDRTGVLCAVLLRIAGWRENDVVADYLLTNRLHADLIEREAERFGAGMTAHERAVLMSFLEARPSYLHAFFDEVDRAYGSFERYVRDGLRLSSADRDNLQALMA